MAPLTWTLLHHRLRVLLLFFKIKTRSSHRLTIWEWHNVLRTESYHLLLSTAREIEEDWCCIPFPFLITTKVKSLSKGTDFPSDDLLLWSLSKRPFHRQRLYSSSSAFHKLLLLLLCSCGMKLSDMVQSVVVCGGVSVSVVAGINFVYISTDVICNGSTNPLEMFDEI